MRIATLLTCTMMMVGFVGCALPGEQSKNIDYGDPPTDYEAAIRAHFDRILKDPSSVQYREITQPEKGFFRGPIIAGGQKTFGWLVKATVNAKNSYGGYVGFKTYTFLFRREHIVDVLAEE
jgi:hypothetical protein